jgi:hypothetical protein
MAYGMVGHDRTMPVKLVYARAEFIFVWSGDLHPYQGGFDPL